MMLTVNRIPLIHLDRLTDDTGLIQHAIYHLPRRDSGYTTDDNARALRLCTRMWSHLAEDTLLERIDCYLSFLEFARTENSGFHNFMSYQRQWLDAEGSGDSQGQAVRALAEVLGAELPDDNRDLARELLKSVLPHLADLRSLRAQAYVILSYVTLWEREVENIEKLETIAWFAAKRLVECVHRYARPDWKWFEGQMTYANAVLPHALILAGKRWPKEPFANIALETFEFLDRETTAQNAYWPVGNHNWYAHQQGKSTYDQQPIEAATMAEAALAAWDLYEDKRHLMTFERAHGWFHGRNSLKLVMGNVLNGACYDGLEHHGVNRNQGAESTLAFLWTELLYVEAASAQLLPERVTRTG